jgi:hypothetical protein
MQVEHATNAHSGASRTKTLMLSSLIESTEFFIAKLERYTADVDDKEMQWTPSGINNSLAWILRHCADLMWLCFGRLSGEQIPANLADSGIAWSSAKGTAFDVSAEAPGPDAEEQMAYLTRAWETLKTYLQARSEWHAVELVMDRKRRSSWAFLQHSLGDLYYHTGQASYLRKLLAAERRQVRARRQRAESTGLSRRDKARS